MTGVQTCALPISAIHPENLVRLGDGTYAITDLADCTSLFDLDDPRDFYVNKSMMTKFFETPGLTQAAKDIFATVLAGKLGLRFDGNDNLNLFLWTEYFCLKYFERRKTLLDVDRDIEVIGHRFDKSVISDEPKLIVGLVRGSLEKERKFLEGVSRVDPVAAERMIRLVASLKRIDTLLQDPKLCKGRFTSAESFRALYE